MALLVFGDALQLMPVKDKSLALRAPDGGKNEERASISNLGMMVWRGMTDAIELTKMMRQDGASQLGQQLAKLRREEGQLADDDTLQHDLDFWNKRSLPFLSNAEQEAFKNNPTSIIGLPTHAMVDEMNTNI